MGTAERREREAAHRRAEILSAARKLFWQQGYVGTTMPQLADATELAPGTLYLYFPSKEALYVELVFEGYKELERRLKDAVAAQAEPRGQAEALVEAFFQFAASFPEYFDIIFFVTRREGTGGWKGTFPPELVGRLYEREAACKAVAAQVLDRAWDAHLPEEKQVALEAVWSMLSGVIFCFKGDEKFPTVAEEAKQLILAGVLGR
ncbi:MAG: TetR/AcrR family transcriptional regulator [Planctomycetota bacterium]|jgi:AcrR family transcriptional regulator